jgi:hypothetical protein
MPGPDEAQRPVRALADADARSDGDLELRLLTPSPYYESSAIQPAAVLTTRNRKSLSQFAGTIGQAADCAPPVAPLMHSFEARQGLQRADQNTPGVPFPVCHDIQAFVHAVDEIHVGSAGWSE